MSGSLRLPSALKGRAQDETGQDLKNCDSFAVIAVPDRALCALEEAGVEVSSSFTMPSNVIPFERKNELHDRVTAVYEDARDDVYYYVLTLGLSPGQAQEAAQEVFLRLYVSLKNGEDIQNVRGWVFRVAHNFALKLKAKEREHSGIDGHLELAAADHTPERQVLDKERDERVREALEELSPQQRQCLHLRASGLRYREIGETLGIGTSTVNEFLRRAITRLKKALHE